MSTRWRDSATPQKTLPKPEAKIPVAGVVEPVRLTHIPMRALVVVGVDAAEGDQRQRVFVVELPAQFRLNGERRADPVVVLGGEFGFGGIKARFGGDVAREVDGFGARGGRPHRRQTHANPNRRIFPTPLVASLTQPRQRVRVEVGLVDLGVQLEIAERQCCFFAGLMIFHRERVGAPEFTEILAVAGELQRLGMLRLAVEEFELADLIVLLVDPAELARVAGVFVDRESVR